jgi:hypothetical protein
MSVVKVVTLHANVAYVLVLEAWVVEDGAAEVQGAAEARGAAVAVAQDIVGAQAMVEGATAHGIVLPGSEITADHHRLPVPEASAGLRRLPVRVVSAGLHRLPAREASAGLRRLPAREASAGLRRLPAREVSAGHLRVLVSGAIAGPRHSHPSVKSPHMLMTHEHFGSTHAGSVGRPSVCFPKCFLYCDYLDCHAAEYVLC